MTFKELESLINTMEQEHAEYLEKSQQKIQMLKEEIMRMKNEYLSEKNPSGSGIRDYMLERAKHYYGDHVILPQDNEDLVDVLYETTNGKMKEEQVVFIIDEKEFTELAGMNRMLVAMMPVAPLVSIDKCLLFFCEDRLVVLEPDDEEYNLAAMFKYKIIDRVIRFDDVIRIDIVENAKEDEDYYGDLDLPEMESAVEKSLTKLLLNLRDYQG